MLQTTQLFDLTGKVALVTGASSGLGAHFAKVLATQGARVVLAARRTDKLTQLETEITQQGGQALSVAMDVTDRNSIEQAFQNIIDHWECPDIVVSNAGTAATELFLKMSEDNWDKVMDTNLKGVYLTGQVAAQAMQQAGKPGSIINTASILGLAVQTMQSSYATAKAGVIQLTRMMALELSRFNIRVNAIAPGYFKTEINTGFLESDMGKQYVDNTLPRRVGELDELTGVIMLLASDASTYINGTVINVDGGTLLKGV